MDKMDKTSEEIVWASEETRKERGRRRGVKGKEEEEGVDFTTLSSTAMGRGLGVFRREKKAIVCVVILESNFLVSLSGLHNARL